MKIVKSIPKFGDISWDTQTVQEQLRDLYSNNVTVDGIFGKETFDTLVAFQKAKGIETNQPGYIGPMTLKLLDLIVVGMNNSTGKLTITNDLRGKKDRHLHPSLRIFLEAELFPSAQRFISSVLSKVKFAVRATVMPTGAPTWKRSSPR